MARSSYRHSFEHGGDNLHPDSLTALDQWIVWRYEQRDGGKSTKVPYQVNGSRASSTDPKTWCSWDDVLKACQENPGRWSGVGFVFSPDDPLFGIDLDQCLDAAGKLKPWAQPIMARFFDSYAEISPSGRGIKIWAKGRLPVSGTTFRMGDGRVEIYGWARYFTVTGNHWPGQMLDVEEHQADLDWLLAFSRHGQKIVPFTTEGKIPDGSQHDTLVSGTTLGWGCDCSETEGELLQINRSALEALTPEEDTKQIVGSLCMDAPGDKRGIGSAGRDPKAPTETVTIPEMAIAELTGPEPETPDMRPLLEIHRHRDGVVTFHRKGTEPGQFENLFGVRAINLPEMFPDFREALDCDSYFSINAFWHPDQKSNWLPATVRHPGRLRFLCAAYADLDIHNLEIDSGTALATALRYQDDGVIPPASLIVRSGRGMWLLWLLHDAKCPSQPPRAFPEKLRLYLEVNRAIGERLYSLGADVAARDAVRLMRVPGSTHPLATECPRVRYWIQAGEQGKPFSYTLDDLARRVLAVSPVAFAERKALLAAERPTGKEARGSGQLNARRLREFSALRSMRGGFAEGCRNHAVLIYAWLLRCNRMAPDAILRESQALAIECKPPLSAVETRQVVKTATSRKFVRMRDQTISDWLGVTPEECAHLERLPAASRFGRKQDAPPEKFRQVERRTAMSQVLLERPTVPSCREMVRLLRGRQIEISHTQVLRDYKALDIKAVT